MSFYFFYDATGYFIVEMSYQITWQPVSTVYFIRQIFQSGFSQNERIPEILQIFPRPAENVQLEGEDSEPQPQEIQVASGVRQRRPRLHILEKQLQSARKNSESNIINQLFSFFSNNDKSESIVDRAIELLKLPQNKKQKAKAIFYNIVRLINYQRGRKYINRQTIRGYFLPGDFMTNFPEIEEKLSEVGVLTLEELCFLFRVCTTHFIKNTSTNAILTSKRVTLVAKCEHLKRRRRVEASFSENIE